jgi:hypothetical protein
MDVQHAGTGPHPPPSGGAGGGDRAEPRADPDRRGPCDDRLRLHRGGAGDPLREPADLLWQDLAARRADWEDAGIRSVRVIGDAEAPGPIAWATYAGHRYARELDTEAPADAPPFRRELAALAAP